LLAAAIFSSMFGFFIFSHLIAPEPFLGLALGLVFWSFMNAWAEPKRAPQWFAWAWIFMALGTMIKGAHGALLPLGVAGILALAHRKTRGFWKGLLSWPGLFWFLLLVVPWYVAIELRYPGFLRDNFINEQWGHLVNKRWPPDAEQVPLGIFGLQHVLYLWPWVLFGPAALRAWWKEPRTDENRILSRMVWAWIGLVVAGVLFSTRQDHYTVIIWGAVAIWLALPWVSEQPLSRKWLLAPCAVVAVVGAAVVIGAALVAPRVWAAPASVTPAFAHVDLFASVTGFSGGAWRHALWMIGGTGLVMLAGGAVSGLLVWRNRAGAAGLALTAMMIFPCAMVIRGYAMKQDYFSLGRIGETLNKVAKPGTVVVCQGEPHQNSSLFFYFDRPVHWIGARPDGDFVQRTLHIGSELYWHEEKLREAWKSERQVYLIAEASSLPAWKEKLGLTPEQLQILERSGTRVLIRNR